MIETIKELRKALKTIKDETLISIELDGNWYYIESFDITPKEIPGDKEHLALVIKEPYVKME